MIRFLAPLLLVATLAGCGPDPAEEEARLKDQYIASCERNMSGKGLGPGKLGSFCRCWQAKASARYTNRELVDGLTGPGPKPQDMADEIRACQAENQ